MRYALTYSSEIWFPDYVCDLHQLHLYSGCCYPLLFVLLSQGIVETWQTLWGVLAVYIYTISRIYSKELFSLCVRFLRLQKRNKIVFNFKSKCLFSIIYYKFTPFHTILLPFFALFSHLHKSFEII